MSEAETISQFDRQSVVNAANERATQKLLALLKKHHAPEEIEEPKKVASPSIVSKPIPNHMFAIANALMLDEPRSHLPAPTVLDVQLATCKYFDITRKQLFSKRRTQKVVRPRQIAICICRSETTLSLPQIARLFGSIDHTTVLHAARKIDDLARTDISIAMAVAYITAEVSR